MSTTEDDARRTEQDADQTSFLTQTYKKHARRDDFNRNKISKPMIDLSRVALDDIEDVDSIHLPIRKHCQQRNLLFRPNDSLFIVNHYLGSHEQFTYRENDARNGIVAADDNKPGGGSAEAAANATRSTTKVNVRNAQYFRDQQSFKYPLNNDDEILPWLDGFRDRQKSSSKTSDFLLEGSGRLEPKSWRRIFRNHLHKDEERTPQGLRGTNERPSIPDSDRCALLFFGLNRSYKTMVLPSIVENILRPNARHRCDVYVHFYEQDSDAPGRRNDGGKLFSEDIFLLKEAALSTARHYRKQFNNSYGDDDDGNEPVVGFGHDTEKEWEESKSRDLLRKYHATKTDNNTEAYFPWAAKTYTTNSLDNIVKQWHSIQSVFKLMDYYQKNVLQNVTYTRVGMFRSDCLYVTPIDIASLGNGGNRGSSSSSTTTEESGGDGDDSERKHQQRERYDINNQYFVTPSFALQPVNDRLVYGPYEAVKVWATQRFELVEERASSQVDPGYTMHSERFLHASVFPAMEDRGYAHAHNGNICFLRTRVGDAAFVNDCATHGLLPTPLTSEAWNSEPSDATEKRRLALVESVVGKPCRLKSMGETRRWSSVVCET